MTYIYGYFVLGLAFGSFINALVWRMHEATTRKGKVKKSDLSIWHGRSMCTHCSHQLAWYDLVPVLSWLTLRGRCRYCHHPIEDSPLVELATAGLFVSLGLSLPTGTAVEAVTLVFWLVASIVLVALALYDLRWLLLPNRLMYPLLAWAGLYVVALGLMGESAMVIDCLIGAAVSGGLFYGLFQLSGGRWLGGGDVKLAFFIGLALASWRDALLGITLASWLGLAAYGILGLTGRTVRHRQLPFGPCLIAATYLILFFGDWLIDSYLHLAGLH